MFYSVYFCLKPIIDIITAITDMIVLQYHDHHGIIATIVMTIVTLL